MWIHFTLRQCAPPPPIRSDGSVANPADYLSIFDRPSSSTMGENAIQKKARD